MTQSSAPIDHSRAAGVRASALRLTLLCLAIAAVMLASGMARSWVEAATWFGESLLGVAVGIATARWIVPASWLQRRALASAVLIAAVISAPIAALVLAQIALVDRRPLSLDVLVHVAPSVFATSLVITGLAFMIGRQPAHAAPADAPPPRFLERLPPKLRGAELYAVEAEDHYLRLHTSLGQDLILMRLADAVAELDGIEGAQTHRSWWVARAAVRSAVRQDGRATLTLADGAEAPVSRGFARQLRAAGWF